MNRTRGISLLFVLAALYDGLLGISFLLAANQIYTKFGVTAPNHPGYVQFPAALLIIFGIMFLAVARNPVGNRNLIPYAMLLKVAYCGVVLFHWVGDNIPDLWKPFCIADLFFLVAFTWAWLILRSDD